MRREEIDLVYASGRDAVAALIAAQAERIDELTALNATLTARVDELERQAGRSSRNSSLPPSRDSPDARKARAKKERSGRRQGGQPGHPGQHRELVADPDRLVEHWPSVCAGCGEPIADRVCDATPRTLTGRALVIFEHRLGPGHPYTRQARANLENLGG